MNFWNESKIRLSLSILDIETSLYVFIELAPISFGWVHASSMVGSQDV